MLYTSFFPNILNIFLPVLFLLLCPPFLPLFYILSPQRPYVALPATLTYVLRVYHIWYALNWLFLKVQGLNSAQKRVKVFRILCSHRIHVTHLQENHFAS